MATASAYPGLIYPGQAYPGVEGPPQHASDTTWGSWVLGSDGSWIRRETRVLVWGITTPPALDPLIDGNGAIDTIWDGNGTTTIYDGNGTTS